jgi:hypothetical protein
MCNFSAVLLQDYVLPNNRHATLFYHDHSVGITSENVYAGEQCDSSLPVCGKGTSAVCTAMSQLMMGLGANDRSLLAGMAGMRIVRPCPGDDP